MSDFKMQDGVESPGQNLTIPSFFTNAILMISDLAFKIVKEGCESDDTGVPVWIVDNLVKK